MCCIFMYNIICELQRLHKSVLTYYIVYVLNYMCIEFLHTLLFKYYIFNIVYVLIDANCLSTTTICCALFECCCVMQQTIFFNRIRFCEIRKVFSLLEEQYLFSIETKCLLKPFFNVKNR